MEFYDDPEEMTPEQRLGEIAAILAAGYLRLKARPFTENPLDSFATPMPLSGEGLTDGEPALVEAAG